MAEPIDLFDRNEAPWQERLEYMVETMRNVSGQTDPHAMVKAYGERMRVTRNARMLSLSRRGVEAPKYIVARDTGRGELLNPWKEREQLPVLEGGLLGKLVYSNQAHVINELKVDEDDPYGEVLSEYGSLVALPVFDGGEALNLVVFLRERGGAFDPEDMPQLVWTTNLFGRATHNLVLTRQVESAYEMLDRELKEVADVQRSLLPATLPEIPSLDLAYHYRPAHRAGGDYFDFFPLKEGLWGILIADVSGHGSPAAVEMAITRTLAHLRAKKSVSPPDMLGFLNEHLFRRSQSALGTFVTAFYGVYDPATRSIRYSSAGHPPPRIKRCSDGSLFSLEGGGGPPLGVVPTWRYEEAAGELVAGDQFILYTDGITEAFNPKGEMFGAERLDGTIENCSISAQGLIEEVLEHLDAFREGRALSDDLTLVVARVT
ncbi:MAG: PP2C family protein-serine/threonine phosphatase [Planctomycetota bacterium]|jgi:sigma-B regulation protein RsbU (phosphoserine phosphatase)